MQFTFKRVNETEPNLMDILEELGRIGYHVVCYVPSGGRDIPGWFLLEMTYGTPEVTIAGDVSVDINTMPNLKVSPISDGSASPHGYEIEPDYGF